MLCYPQKQQLCQGVLAFLSTHLSPPNLRTCFLVPAGKGEVFHKGVAISMWQNSGDDDSNWTNFIKSNFPFKALPFGFKRFSGKHSVLQTCPDTWNRCAAQQRLLLARQLLAMQQLCRLAARSAGRTCGQEMLST